MRTTIISASIAGLLSALTVAQSPPPGRPGVPPTPGAESAAVVADDAPRFDLNFPGGNVREFVAAVTKALGRPVNVIIPKEAEATTIPPVEVYAVTVNALFGALSNASMRQVLVENKNAPNLSGYRETGFHFVPQDNRGSPETVWTFQVMAPPELRTEEPVTAARAVQYYPVAEYLSHFDVEDITTAIESGWQLQGGELAKAPPPILRFHEETKLLICAGSPQQLEVIPQVLAGLGQLLGFPRTDNLEISRKAEAIIIPRVEFKEASVQEAIEFIRKKALENDPEKKGINIVLNEVNGPADRKLTITLSDIPILEVLRFTAELAELDFQIRDTAIVLTTGGKTNPTEGDPARAGTNPPTIPGLAVPNVPGFPPAQGFRGGPTNGQAPGGRTPGSRR
ncbi:MAG TPA: hypothetical protein VFV83_06365 [Chthoniobacteraceae bacterium]|nr:hypothetical protein [Chthoniobacteraceae bacterium]